MPFTGFGNMLGDVQDEWQRRFDASNNPKNFPGTNITGSIPSVGAWKPPPLPGPSDNYGPGFNQFMSLFGNSAQAATQAMLQDMAIQRQAMQMKMTDWQKAQGGLGRLEGMYGNILGQGGGTANPNDAQSFGFLAPQIQAMQAAEQAQQKQIAQAMPRSGARDLAEAEARNAGYGQMGAARGALVQQALQGLMGTAALREGQPVPGYTGHDPTSALAGAYGAGLNYNTAQSNLGLQGYEAQNQATLGGLNLAMQQYLGDKANQLGMSRLDLERMLGMRGLDLQQQKLQMEKEQQDSGFWGSLFGGLGSLIPGVGGLLKGLFSSNKPSYPSPSNFGF